MRLLILGEGTTDLGHFTADGELELDGVLPILVRRIAESFTESTLPSQTPFNSRF